MTKSKKVIIILEIRLKKNKSLNNLIKIYLFTNLSILCVFKKYFYILFVYYTIWPKTCYISC